MNILSMKKMFYILLSNWKKVLVLITLVTIVLFKNYWLPFFIILCILTYYLVHFSLEKIVNLVIRKILKGVFLLLCALVLSIITKMLVGEIYRIPGSSMKNTLFPEDVVIVNKLTYGPRLPRNPYDISWIKLD